jgi:hypothetical protein
MRALGSGLEYKAYDKGGGRILKVRRSLPSRAVQTILYSVRCRNISMWPLILRNHFPATNGLPALATPLSAMPPETRKLFGNIEIVRDCDYTQDKVTPLRDFNATHSLEENIAVMDRYVGMIQQLWSLGIGDPYYNFQWNAGVYEDGTVAQLDVADLVTNVAVLGEHTKQKVWLVTALPGIEDQALRSECARILNNGLTYEAFLERWPAIPVFPEISHATSWRRGPA